MDDDPTPRWLPPKAPGGDTPPRFEPAPPAPPEEARPTFAEPAAPHLQAAPPAAGGRPTFVRGGQRSGNGLAVAALVLGISGVGLLLITLGAGFMIALPCSIAAWICGAQARKQANPAEAGSGRAQAQAAYQLGIVGVLLGVIAAIGWIVAIAAGVDLDELRRDIERQTNPDARQAAIAAVRALLAR
jgi:hypothetical protein